MPGRGQQRIEMHAQRRAGARRYPLELPERGRGHALALRERMFGAHDDGQRIVEQVLLHHVGGGRRVAQRADQHFGLARAQTREQVLIGSFDDRRRRAADAPA